MAGYSNPPPTTLWNSPLPTMDADDFRAVGFHALQMMQIVGSKDVDFWPITQEEDMHTYTGGFFASGCVGSGPIYNINLRDNSGSPDDLSKIQIGDHLIIRDDTGNDTDTDDISWYRYDVVDIFDNTTDTANISISVKYIDDTLDFGDQSPCDMYINYGTYGYGVAGSGYIAAVIREVNPQFLLGDL